MIPPSQVAPRKPSLVDTFTVHTLKAWESALCQTMYPRKQQHELLNPVYPRTDPKRPLCCDCKPPQLPRRNKALVFFGCMLLTLESKLRICEVRFAQHQTIHARKARFVQFCSKLCWPLSIRGEHMAFQNRARFGFQGSSQPTSRS